MAKLSQEAILRAVPHRNRAVQVEPREEGLLLSVPLRRVWWAPGIVRWLFRISEVRSVQLDALGSHVLSFINGRRSVEKVIEKMMREYNLSFYEARISVLQFLKMLTERGLIGLHMAGEDHG